MAEKKKAYRRWVELTEQATAPLAAEAEGRDSTKLRRPRGRPSIGSAPGEALPVRLEPELRQALDERAAAGNTTPTEIVREALHRYLEVTST
jgi:hypothetical protein